MRPIFLTTDHCIFLVIAMTYKSHPRTMKIKVAAFGYLGRAQRPAPLKEKLFRKLETGNQKPTFLTTGNFIFLVITIS